MSTSATACWSIPRAARVDADRYTQVDVIRLADLAAQVDALERGAT